MCNTSKEVARNAKHCLTMSFARMVCDAMALEKTNIKDKALAALRMVLCKSAPFAQVAQGYALAASDVQGLIMRHLVVSFLSNGRGKPMTNLKKLVGNSIRQRKLIRTTRKSIPECNSIFVGDVTLRSKNLDTEGPTVTDEDASIAMTTAVFDFITKEPYRPFDFNSEQWFVSMPHCRPGSPGEDGIVISSPVWHIRKDERHRHFGWTRSGGPDSRQQ